MASKEETELRLADLIKELGEPSEYTFHVPGWSPIDSGDGFHWFRATLWEGFYVAYKIDHASKQVHFKSWEHGEPEPSWGSLSYAT
jgi:hypothetical protein